MNPIILPFILLLAVSFSLLFFLKDNEESSKGKVTSGPISTTPSITKASSDSGSDSSSTKSILDIRYYINLFTSPRSRYEEDRPKATPAGTIKDTRSATPAGTIKATTPSATPTSTLRTSTPSATYPAVYTTAPTNQTFATPSATPSAMPLATPSATPSAMPLATPSATPSATYPSVYTSSPQTTNVVSITTPSPTPSTMPQNNKQENFTDLFKNVESFTLKDVSSNDSYDLPENYELYNTEGNLFTGKHDSTNYGELLSDMEAKYENLKLQEPPKCNTPIKCIADFGTDIGDDLCCGQTGVLQDTKYVCPSNKPTCGNFKCGSQFGQCS